IFPGETEPVSGSYVVLTVADTGKGIPMELREKLFEPFFTTKSPGRGTGLGLTTVRGIIQAHGGFLEMASEVGKGTLFAAYFPAAIPTGETSARPDASNPFLGAGQQVL